jgi:hypothetical protein
MWPAQLSGAGQGFEDPKFEGKRNGKSWTTDDLFGRIG